MSTSVLSPIRRLTPSDSSSLRLAAIDVGSNSVHMVIAQADPDGAMTTLWRMKEMVGLGRMSFPSRRLSAEAMGCAIEALRRFHTAAQQRQAVKTLAVATSAVREATNGGDFILRVKRELGLYVRVISAREEARLIYLAVRHNQPLGERPHLIIDIGGGSVEFIVANQQQALLLESRKLGAARMTAKFVKSDPISKPDLERLRRQYDTELTSLCSAIADHRPVRVLGTSGTLECIAAMCHEQRPGGSNGDGLPAIEPEMFAKVLAKLIDSNAAQRAKIPGVHDQRRDQILAGALLVDELFTRLKIKKIEICPAALREGILLDYVDKHVPEMTIRRKVPDPRRRSVLDLARRCDWNQAHSEQVARLCLSMFDQLRELHNLSGIERELIEYAALLHDIGWHIGKLKHHKHSMYLITNGELKDFTPEEVSIIANIARYHRKSTPKRTHESYAALSSWGRRCVDVGAALLRIADGLDRSHTSAVSRIRCKVKKRSIALRLLADSDVEMELWGAKRKMDWFEQVFGRKIRFELANR